LDEYWKGLTSEQLSALVTVLQQGLTLHILEQDSPEYVLLVFWGSVSVI
jgi:hypothetical protein